MLQRPVLSLLLLFLSLLVFFGCAATQVPDQEPIEIWAGEWTESDGDTKLDGQIQLLILGKIQAGGKDIYQIMGKVKSKGILNSSDASPTGYRMNLTINGTIAKNSLLLKASGSTGTNDIGGASTTGELVGTISNTGAVIHCNLTHMVEGRGYKTVGTWELKPVIK